MKSSYLTYAMSVIISRALPDVRDGLKPSQRRVLVAMHDLNLRPGGKFRKCAKIAGDTSGNYHPHGEAVIYPTLVQGPQAADQIVAALRRANARAECDVLLLTRGGGSLEDLWPFNEEAVARAVYTCTTPIVSAVGHEIDVVITDFVADHRAAEFGAIGRLEP